ncbi:hypothetical protein QE369_002052 [Agrobacterium larrymoorei]|uniref:Uncharacterized protein n=1 Tax=Agrobacterium larrymoorei TaxID=160699 RepID=A0AAJ2BLM5_9HYPH|nr:hypothetical protein [Agrobacterium larrymoorei]MDR6101855.1 hypothetical protein [Agrobacterium larrymoorei]
MSAIPIGEFIREKKFHMIRCNVDGLPESVAVPASEVGDFFDKLQMAWGTHAPYYLSVKMPDEQGRPLALEDAIRQIEQTSSEDFLFVHVCR